MDSDVEGGSGAPEDDRGILGGEAFPGEEGDRIPLRWCELAQGGEKLVVDAGHGLWLAVTGLLTRRQP